MEVDWTTPDSALVREQDYTGVLHFHVTSVMWTLDADNYAIDEQVEVDYDQRIALTQERVRLAVLDESVRGALIAEWEGRVRMFRDETRDLAVMGARIAFRKAIKNL